MTYNQRSGNAYAGGGGAAGLDQAAVEALIDARDFDAVVSRANATPSQAPTAAEIDGVTPENGTDVMVFLTDGTREHWQFDGTFWILQSSYTPATGTCLVPVSDPEAIGAATGTLADGTTWTVGNDQDPAGNVFSTVTPGDIRWPTAGPLTLTFSAPVTLLVSPTTLGDAAIGDPIVWGYQNGQGTFSQTSTRVTTDGDPMSYQPGAFDTTMVFSNGDLQANGNLPESAAPTASTDWGLLTAPRGTVFTVRDRNASAMNFQAVPLVERDICDVLAELVTDTTSGPLVVNNEVYSFVEARCYSTPGAAFDDDRLLPYLDEINDTQRATLPAGPHMRWTAPIGVVLTELQVARLGAAGDTTISWTTSNGQTGTHTATTPSANTPIPLGTVALDAGDTIDFTLDGIPGGQMQLAVEATMQAGGWTALQDYTGFATTSYWSARLIGTESDVEVKVNVYSNGTTELLRDPADITQTVDTTGMTVIDCEPAEVAQVPANPMSTALPTSGTITATAGHVNYGTATLTADADIDTAALLVGDVASYELVVPAGVTLTLPADSTIVRGSIIEDFINLVQIEKVDTAEHRVRIYSRPQITDTLVTRQDITGGTNFFASLAEANNFDAANPNPETSAKFSILDQVEGMRRLDGQLEFELRYPAAGITAGPTGADLVVRWEQTSNPFVGSSNDAGQNNVTGFQLISESPPFDQFGGLCLIGSSTTAETTFYNGQPGSTNWWSGVGAFATWTALGTGIPARADVGANHSTATIVELRVMNIGA